MKTPVAITFGRSRSDNLRTKKYIHGLMKNHFHMIHNSHFARQLQWFRMADTVVLCIEHPAMSFAYPFKVHTEKIFVSNTAIVQHYLPIGVRTKIEIWHRESKLLASAFAPKRHRSDPKEIRIFLCV